MPDLITIPGIPELWTHTKGDSRIKIAILDGAADLDRACFQWANFTQFKPYWTEDIELIDEYYHYLKLATDFNQQQKAKNRKRQLAIWILTPDSGGISINSPLNNS